MPFIFYFNSFLTSSLFLRRSPGGPGINAILPVNGMLIVFHVYSQLTGQWSTVISHPSQGQFGEISWIKNDLNNISHKRPTTTMNAITAWSEGVNVRTIWSEQHPCLSLWDTDIWVVRGLHLSYSTVRVVMHSHLEALVYKLFSRSYMLKNVSVVALVLNVIKRAFKVLQCSICLKRCCKLKAECLSIFYSRQRQEHIIL